MDTLDRERLLSDLKDIETRRLFYMEHITTGLPIQTRELRQKRGMTQKQLGAVTGMDQATISKLENPNYEYTPQIGTLQRLADAFDVPLIVRFGSWGELFEWESDLSPDTVAPPKFEDDAKIKRAAKPVAPTTSGIQATLQGREPLQGSEPTGKLLEFTGGPKQGSTELGLGEESRGIKKLLAR